MKKLSSKKGFTLAELLIVVAIIAVLVAIALPVFGNALSKAQLSADAANFRAWMAEEIVNAMVDENYVNGVITITVTATAPARDANTTLGGGETAGNAVTLTRTGLDAVTIPVDNNVIVDLP